MKKVLAFLIIMAIAIPAYALDWTFEEDEGSKVNKITQIIIKPLEDSMLIRGEVFATVDGTEYKIGQFAKQATPEQYDAFITANVNEASVTGLWAIINYVAPVEEEVTE